MNNKVNILAVNNEMAVGKTKMFLRARAGFETEAAKGPSLKAHRPSGTENPEKFESFPFLDRIHSEVCRQNAVCWCKSWEAIRLAVVKTAGLMVLFGMDPLSASYC